VGTGAAAGDSGHGHGPEQADTEAGLAVKGQVRRRDDVEVNDLADAAKMKEAEAAEQGC
jgi:hypothetical protein